MDELKRCPFCGGEAEIKECFFTGFHKELFIAKCKNIGCGAIGSECVKKETAIEKWNNRPSPWHTGTPTEAGDYYIAFRYFIGADVEYGWASWDGKGWDINFMGWDFSNKILAWHKIEPYKED